MSDLTYVQVVEEIVDDQGDPYAPPTTLLTKQPYTVPDGKWVANPFSGSHVGFWTIGPEPERVVLASHDHGRDILLVGDEPFGAIHYTRPQGGLRFEVALRVTDGQLGVKPGIAKPRFAREGRDNTREWTAKRDRRRGYATWVNVQELFLLAELSPRQLLHGFWPFVDYQWHPDYGGEVKLQLRCAAEFSGIHLQPPASEVVGYSLGDLESLLCQPTDWGQYWLRGGFAKTVLYLLNFGYKPYQEELPQPRRSEYSDEHLYA